MKKAFTLIELLAVIIVLAVIALIATPIVINVIDKAQENADLATVRSILDGARLYKTESMFDSNKEADITNLNNIYHKVSVSPIPEDGELYINTSGYTAIAVVIHDRCYTKEFANRIDEISISESEECGLGYIGNDSVIPTITFSVPNNTFNINGWAKENFFVTVNPIDNDSGINNTLWCLGTGNCEPIATLNGSIEVNNEADNNVICAIATDNAGNESVKTCSDLYKLDKTVPSFTGIIDLTLNVNAELDLENSIEISDILSGVDGEYTITPSTVDTSVTGTTDVVYSAIDKAGNIREVTRRIIVDADAPVITYNPLGNKINENDWSKEDFFVDVSITDNSNSGINEAKWCTSSDGICTPTSIMTGTTMSPKISTESNNNRICIYVKDNNNKETTLCSDAYKLDKEAPTAGTADFTGTMGSNDWYTSNVTVNIHNGSDSLSGHNTTTSNIASITDNTNGTTVTITTTDLAGNTNSRDYVIKVDKNSPSVSLKDNNTPSIIKETNYDVSNYFNVSYSISGGTLNCNPINTNSLEVGNHTITCTATGNNGLTGTNTKTINVKTEDVESGVQIACTSNQCERYIVTNDGYVYAYNSEASRPQTGRELSGSSFPASIEQTGWIKLQKVSNVK